MLRSSSHELIKTLRERLVELEHLEASGAATGTSFKYRSIRGCKFLSVDRRAGKAPSRLRHHIIILLQLDIAPERHPCRLWYGDIGLSVQVVQCRCMSK
jgi:hypothetical protein